MSFTVTEETRKHRYDTCLACEFSHRSPMGLRCGTKIGQIVTYQGAEVELCGCFMKVKTALKGMACPIGKWGTEKISKETACELQAFIKGLDPNRLTSDQVRRLYRFKSNFSGKREDITTCAPCVAQTLHELKQQVKDLNCE